MRLPLNLTLSQRISALMGLAAGAWFVTKYSEPALESSMPEQAKKQALVYLYGLESQMMYRDKPSGP